MKPTISLFLLSICFICTSSELLACGDVIDTKKNSDNVSTIVNTDNIRHTNCIELPDFMRKNKNTDTSIYTENKKESLIINNKEKDYMDNCIGIDVRMATRELCELKYKQLVDLPDHVR